MLREREREKESTCKSRRPEEKEKGEWKETEVARMREEHDLTWSTSASFSSVVM